MKSKLFLFCIIGGFLLSSFEKDATSQENLPFEVNSVVLELLGPNEKEITTNAVSTFNYYNCSGLLPYSPTQYYQIGDRVTHRGDAFQKISNSAWVYLGICAPSTAPTVSICDGLLPYSPTQSYQIGDRVTHRGDAFQKISNSAWEYLGPC